MHRKSSTTASNHKTVRDYSYLIVGGTTKAATTSLFAYLAAHPAICAATYKETRFFLDDTYPLPSKYRYSGDAEEYNLLYKQAGPNELDPRTRLESTPDYLYCPSARERIAEFLPQAKLVFSLREPISRLISWYRFAKQNGTLPQSLSFDGYVNMLFKEIHNRGIAGDRPSPHGSAGACPPRALNTKHTASAYVPDGVSAVAEQHLQTLQQGCYTLYLRPYFERFGAARIHVLFYEDIAEDPGTVLAHLCEFAGIDADFYNDYTFQVTNRTETMKNSELHRTYRNFRFQLRQWTHNKPIIHNPLRAVRRAIEPLYLRLNTRHAEKVTISEATRRRLVDYYRDNVHELAALIGKPIPWHQFCRERKTEPTTVSPSKM